MIRRFALFLGVGAALIIAACIDMSAPKSGVSAISPLLLPSPSVVVGDVMRDSLGAPSPLEITPFDAAGQPVPGLIGAFFVLDSGAHIGPTGLLFGDMLGTVRVVGSLAGIQTLPTSVPVTVAPTAFVRSGTTDSLIVNLAGDTAQNLSNPLSVTLTGAGGAGVAGFVVKYRVVSAPPAAPGKPPTAYIGDDAARPSPADTTDASGLASRRAVLRFKSLGGPLPDSIVVEASTSYKGTPVPTSPARFVVRVKTSP